MEKMLQVQVDPYQIFQYVKQIVTFNCMMIVIMMTETSTKWMGKSYNI